MRFSGWFLSLSIVACNQQVYDSIYKSITVQAISDEATVDERNTVIEHLRALCNGQRSTYEIGNPLDHVGGAKQFNDRLKRDGGIK